MVRGPVVAAEGHAWSTGRLRSSDYFPWARRRAFAKASDAVRERLRRVAQGDGNGRAR
ncbi:MAG TPA: hypothetical protein VFA46_21560 [Actinomycetes bacterium]|jgi:hypothetical protein|nr:hypothetical protein [Actinomycetes bacterium]